MPESLEINPVFFCNTTIPYSWINPKLTLKEFSNISLMEIVHKNIKTQ